MFKRIRSWWAGLRARAIIIRNCIELQRDPMVYEDGINYNISPDTIKNQLIRVKALKVWIRLWDMTAYGNKLRLPGVIKWKGESLDLMKSGDLTPEELNIANAFWVGLFCLMFNECKERYDSGTPSLET